MLLLRLFPVLALVLPPQVRLTRHLVVPVPPVLPLLALWRRHRLSQLLAVKPRWQRQRASRRRVRRVLPSCLVLCACACGYACGCGCKGSLWCTDF